MFVDKQQSTVQDIQPLNPGADFMKGLRLSPISGSATGSKSELFGSAKSLSQMVFTEWASVEIKLIKYPLWFSVSCDPFCSQNIPLMTCMFLV